MKVINFNLLGREICKSAEGRGDSKAALAEPDWG